MSSSTALPHSEPDRNRSKTAYITLDLESDWFVNEPGRSYFTFEYLPEYIRLINSLEVPVTIFVVGRLLEDRPEAVERLRTELETEFHLHSYSHDPEMADGFRTDLRRGMDAFETFFGRRPMGYRAPLGKITDSQLRILDEAGFSFDSSIFPSYRPGAYNNLSAPLEPYRPNDTDSLVELPVGVVPYLRVPLAQSYLKLGGSPLFQLVDRLELPEPLVFVSHLHDFFETAANEHRSQPMKAIQQRNLSQSPELFERFITTLRQNGYEFELLGAASEQRVETRYA